jgi:hypothetical protein
MGTQIQAGSESLTVAGFPFAWVASDFASSMAYIVAWGAFLFDIGLWLLACHLMIAIAVCPQVEGSPQTIRAVSAVVVRRRSVSRLRGAFLVDGATFRTLAVGWLFRPGCIAYPRIPTRSASGCDRRKYPTTRHLAMVSRVVHLGAE